MGPWRLIASAGHGAGDHFGNNRADARPVRSDAIRGFLGPHLPDGLQPTLFVLSPSCERSLALSLEMDMAMQYCLVALESQEYIGPFCETPAKNACVVCKASA